VGRVSSVSTGHNVAAGNGPVIPVNDLEVIQFYLVTFGRISLSGSLTQGSFNENNIKNNTFL
jgi:hypothetical protein